MMICLDPGHGGRDGGAVNGSRFEKNDNLRIANMVKTALLKKGLSVIMTRTEDKYVSLQERSDFANSKKADYFISLHRNAFTNSTAKGVENWVYSSADEKTQDVATEIMNYLDKVGIQVNRGVKKGNFHVTRETNMPACLLELGFISNQKDNELYDLKLEQYSVAIADAICKSLGVPSQDQDKDDCKDGASCRVYRVQVGAYQQRENAVKIAEELATKGYNAFVV